MPEGKQSGTRRSSTARHEAPRETEGARKHNSEKAPSPLEESFELWTRFSRQSGEAVTEYLRQFGDEQQKNYEKWSNSLHDAARSRDRERDLKEVRARYDEWNRQAEEIGGKIREAFEKTLEPQRELLSQWVKPLLPKEATDDDRAREAMDLVQKLWTGLTTDLPRRTFAALQPGVGVDELIRVQEESVKEFTDSFQKLAQVYFTSPAFVTMFGKSLDTSLDQQRYLNTQEDMFSRMTGLPSRREITELSQAVRDLSDKVSRIDRR